MSIPSISYTTFADGTIAYGTRVIQNFNDLIAGMTDGTKDFSINDLDVAGDFSVDGDITLGDAAADSLVINALVNSNIAPEMSSGAYTLGDSTNQWASMYLDNDVTDGGTIYFNGATDAYLQCNAAGTLMTLAVDATSSLTLDGDGDLTLTDTAGNVELLLNAQGAAVDALITLQNNNSAANAWTILNDNDDGDALHFQYNSSDAVVLETSGVVVFGGGVTGDYFVPTDDDASAPVANRLYKANVPKAWAHMTCGLAGAVTVDNDHNVSSASWANNDLTVSWDTNFADADYSCMSNQSTNQDNFTNVHTLAVGTAIVGKYDLSSGIADDWYSGATGEVSAMGDQ